MVRRLPRVRADLRGTGGAARRRRGFRLDRVEDDADALGDLDIENFPTLLIADAGGASFFGPVTPQRQTAERLIRGALAGGLRVEADPALVARVGALVGERRVAGAGRGISLQRGDRCRRRPLT